MYSLLHVCFGQRADFVSFVSVSYSACRYVYTTCVWLGVCPFKGLSVVDDHVFVVSRQAWTLPTAVMTTDSTLHNIRRQCTPVTVR